MGTTVDIDVPGCDELREPAEVLKDDGITLALSNVVSPVLDMFERTGVLEAVRDEVHATSAMAVAAHADRTGDTPRPEDVTAEAAAGLAELADLVADEEVTRRLRRAIEALGPDKVS